MTKKIAILFFIISVLILITLGFLIVKENAVSTESAKAEGCIQIEKYKFAENIRVLWNDAKYFVSFDDITKTIQLNVWTLKDKKFNFEKISDLKMQCDKPDYNCISKNVEFKLSQFAPPYGLLEYKFNGSIKKMPFSWNSKKALKLGPPINLCGQNVAEIEKSKTFWIQNDLFIYDYDRNIIGQYSMSQLRGTSPASAAVDSKRVLIIDEGSFQPTTCEKILANKVAAERHNIHVEKDQVLVYKTNSTGTVYSYQADFIPRFKTAFTVYKSVVDDQHNTIYYTDSKKLYTIPVNSLKEEVVENTEKSLDFMQLNQGISAESAAYSKSFNKLISFNSNRVFSTDLLTIMNLNAGASDKVSGYWHLFNNKIEHFSAATLNVNDVFYFLKRSSAASEFVAARCSP